MDRTGSDSLIPRRPECDDQADAIGCIEFAERTVAPEETSLHDLVAQLEHDPGESLRALQGLESIDEETRLRIIDGLAASAGRPGVAGLLHLLVSSGDEATRRSARIALGVPEAMAGDQEGDDRALEPLVEEPIGAGAARELVRLADLHRPHLVGCLVTAVDGTGRGSIAVSTSRDGRRSTAVFLCDVGHGVTDAIGQLEDESSEAGGLLREVQARAGGLAVEGVRDLALGLLAGCSMLNAESTAPAVAEWLERTLGQDLLPRPFPAPELDRASGPMTGAELRLRSAEVLDACPSWLDTSTLTFELAEEIVLREGRVAADPERDSGAFRFLFEHRILHRLERYRRMLLWMAWFWGEGGEEDLARSAQVLAWQLSDEQYAVPSHPFAVALTARSLDAAQAKLHGETDPRAVRKQA